MSVDSLLLKFNNDEKQFTRLSLTNGGRPLWGGWPCVQGLEWLSTSRVILCQWHSFSHE